MFQNWYIILLSFIKIIPLDTQFQWTQHITWMSEYSMLYLSILTKHLFSCIHMDILCLSEKTENCLSCQGSGCWWGISLLLLLLYSLLHLRVPFLFRFFLLTFLYLNTKMNYRLKSVWCCHSSELLSFTNHSSCFHLQLWRSSKRRSSCVQLSVHADETSAQG